MGRDSDGAAKARARAKVPLREILDQRLIDALSHPVRGHALAVLNERVASPVEVAREIGVDVNYVSYHFDQLEKKGMIELVRLEPRRGVREHFYRAKETLLIESHECAQMPPSMKLAVSADLFRSIQDDAIRALQAGTFAARDDVHVTWMPKHVDAKGFSDLNRLLTETLERALAIAAESAERLARTGEEAIPTTVAMLGFETPADHTAQEAIAAAAG
jgi:DNA-binding MarR family transcriptional regulator